MIIPIALSIFALSTKPLLVKASIITGQSNMAGKGQNQIKDFGLKSYIRLTNTLPHREEKEWKLVCKMPYNCQFQAWIELDSPPGKVLTFKSTNPLVAYLTPFETQTTEAGKSNYEAKNWISGEGATYVIPAGVTVKSVKYRETGFNTEFAGSFQCNDEDFNILWQRAARTSYLCMRDHFYDCPDRERVGFWGDGTPELNNCFYIFDSKSHELCRDLVLRKLEPKFYPGQHLEFLGEYGIWNYYLHTGDLDSIKSIYDQTKEFLLSTYKMGDPKTWYDWGKDVKDTSVIENCFMYIDLGTLKKMAEVTGHEADIPNIDARRNDIAKNFNTIYWRGSYYQSSDVKTPDDRANAMAINAGLADESKWESINNSVLKTTFYSSSFFDRWVFEALYKIGHEDQAMLRMSTRYRSMIDSPITTLWEHYDRWWESWVDKFDEGSSLNHGWNPPAILLSQDVAGVRPTEPGWKAFDVMPQESFLRDIKILVPSIKGPVKVGIKKTSNSYQIELDSPRNTIARVGIPKKSFTNLSSIEINGQKVWQNNIVIKTQGIEENKEYVTCRLPFGKWKVVGRGKLPLSVAKIPGVKVTPETPLDKHEWVATASVPDTTYKFSGDNLPIDIAAQNALDGDHWTGWRDMTELQHPGQWFQVDMRQAQKFDRIKLENAWACWDFPVGYSITVSNDGLKWSPPIATGHGHLGMTDTKFAPQTARFVRITQTGSDPTYHWSIFEFDIFRTLN